MEEAAPVEAAGEVSSWYDAGIRLGSEAPAEELEKPESEVSSWYDAGIRLVPDEEVADEGAVSSWYDAGIRLGSEDVSYEKLVGRAVAEAQRKRDEEFARQRLALSALTTKDEERPEGEVSSWYDAGIRLGAEVPVEEEVPSGPTEAMTKASAQASAVAALISATTVLGIDLAAFGGVENLETALVVGGLALSQIDDAGPVGTTLRKVGNVSSEVFNRAVYPVAKGAFDFYQENELGWKARALLELSLENAFYALSPEAKEKALQKEAEKQAAEEYARRQAELARQAEEAEREAAELQEYKDSLPFWDPQKYS